MKYDLSVLIPARNEEYLNLTVQSVLKNIRGKTEVLVGLDGSWSNPPIQVPQGTPNLTIVYYPNSIGQRGMTNQLCKLSKAKWVMKLDAHCVVDEGFDVKLLANAQDNWTIVPALLNLHVFDWKCKKCGNTWYQSPTPRHCMNNHSEGQNPRDLNSLCDNTTDFEKVIIFKPRFNKRSEFFRFDTDLHFQYHGVRGKHPDAKGDIAETMSIQGSCFMVTKERYETLNLCDEKFGSWGQQGVEVACKTWLSGGRVVVNKTTYYSHMFRTQGGDFGFPYPLSGKQIKGAREYSRKLFIENTWPLQKYPLSWLIEKFAPLNDKDPKKAPDWHTEAGKQMLDRVNEEGRKFTEKKIDGIMDTVKDILNIGNPTKGIIYYTDNQLNLKIAHAAKKLIGSVGLPITSSSLKRMDFGENMSFAPLKRGYEAYFKQILSALERSTADIIFFCEHDWLYHPSHFEFTPKDKDTFYYNWNWWRVRASDGHAVHYDTQLVPGLVAHRELLLTHYREVVAYLDKVGYSAENANKVGFEPGTHGRVKFNYQAKIERFDSRFPIIDIRHDNNLTASKWSPDAFRNPKNAQGWIESKAWNLSGWYYIGGEPFDIARLESQDMIALK